MVGVPEIQRVLNQVDRAGAVRSPIRGVRNGASGEVVAGDNQVPMALRMADFDVRCAEQLLAELLDVLCPESTKNPNRTSISVAVKSSGWTALSASTFSLKRGR